MKYKYLTITNLPANSKIYIYIESVYRTLITIAGIQSGSGKSSRDTRILIGKLQGRVEEILYFS